MHELPDVQARADARGIALSEVGVRGVAATLSVADPAERHGPLAVTLDLWASLDAERRGGHLSRFGEFVSALGGQLQLQELPAELGTLAARLGSEAVGLRAEFALLLSRPAPLSGMGGEVRFGCALEGRWAKGAARLWQEVTVSVQTLCPCSKEIAERGAHNQRCRLLAKVRSLPGGIPFRELIALCEAQGSAPLYPVLKRVDEKLLTERAYDHPAFVEDVVRELALALGLRRDLLGFRVEARSDESIHPHDAYAVAERTFA